MKDSFVWYRSFYEAVQDLPPETFKTCVTALIEYALNDTEITDDPAARMLVTLAKPQIDANKRRYENGKKGGRPKKETGHIRIETPEWYNRQKMKG